MKVYGQRAVLLLLAPSGRLALEVRLMNGVTPREYGSDVRL